MSECSLAGVSVSFGSQEVLRNVSLRLGDKSKAALSGANGSGKSTLLKVFAGLIQPDAGEISISKNAKAVYLAQSVTSNTSGALIEEAYGAYPAINTNNEDGENNSWERDKDVNNVLLGLGFSKDDYQRNTNDFSSGQKMRIALAKILLQKADFLLLDEPTNYLDIEARFWLLKFLNNFSGGFLLVSHDRFFLDNSINEVFDLFQGNIKRYAGNYSFYEEARNIELESLLKRYAAQEEEIEKTESLIRRFRYKSSKAAMVQERIKKLEKMERIEIPSNLKKINFTLLDPPHSGKIALNAENIGKSYENKRIIESLDLHLDAGERLLVCGKNGAGKSTLLRILGGADSDYTGKVNYGTGIITGFFSVDASETLKGSETILEFMEKDASISIIPKIRDMLGAFLFQGDDVYKSIDVLSGGEKSRLLLLKMLLSPRNLMILDEPTNHLDIWTKDILLNAFLKYKGTIIFSCHDRAFMEALSTKTLYLDEGSHKMYYGNYGYFLEKTETAHEDTPSKKIIPNITSNDYFLNKQKTQEMRKQKKAEDALFEKIDALENEKKKLFAELSKPEIYSNNEKAKMVNAEIKRVEAALDAAEAELDTCGGRSSQIFAI